MYPAVRERFGPRSLRPSERSNLQDLLTPTIIFTIKRITHMLGVQLHPNCLAELFTRPSLFFFCEVDLLDCVPRVRHSVPVLAYRLVFVGFEFLLCLSNSLHSSLENKR